MASKKGPPPVVYLLVIIVVGFGGYQLFLRLTDTSNQGQLTDSEKTAQTTKDRNLNQHISSGEKALIPSETINDQAFLRHKQKGLNAMASDNYLNAVRHFDAALQEKRNSPETLIYRNNARIGEQKAWKAAVTVPINTDTVFFALEMLRGYAQAQQEINQAGGINGKPLKLVLADENDDPQLAKKVAKELVQQQDILAVSGHWSSRTTLAAAPIYNRNQLVLVNPVSTSTQISDAGEYIFRTIPSNFIVGSTIADYTLNHLQVQDVAIFYDANSRYSESLRQQLRTAFSSRGATVVAQFNLSNTGFIAQKQLKTAIQQGAKAIVLIPSPNTVDRALQVVNVNNRQLPLIGDIGNLYGIKTLQAGEDAVGMALPLPWHIQKPGSREFVQKSRELWKADVNWATVMAYDAMNAIAEALEQASTRKEIQDVLSSSNFSAPGVVQPVKFLPSGDRDGRLMMVEVQPANPSRSGTGYDFVPVR